MKISHLYTIVIACGLVLASCKKEEPVVIVDPPPTEPTYTIPTTYEFAQNSGVQSSTRRVNMTKELVGYIRTTHTSSYVVISGTRLKNMYSNSASSFTEAALNSSGINLRENTSNTQGLVSELDQLFNEAGTVSADTTKGSNGVAGKVNGLVGTNGVVSVYMCNAKGFEYKELVEKGIMGGVFYAEAMRLLSGIENFDNILSIEGKGTAMETAWDEAFGYLAVPVAFPTTTAGISYWGSYCNSVNGAIGSNAAIMNAFLKGRAAIGAKHRNGYVASRDIIVATWEKIAAARLVTYLKQAKTNFSNDGARNHALSEAVGFIRAFRYNPAKKITDDQINSLMNSLGTNLYQVSLNNIESMISLTCQVFELDQAKL